VVTDPAEVRRLSESKASENLEFRRYLRAHHTGEGPFHVLADRVEREFDCLSCANCCRETLVNVSDEDLRRIAMYLQITVEEVSHLYTAKGTAPGEEHILKSGVGGCAFLDGNLCTIYEARPRVCREFPHVHGTEDTLPHRMSATVRRASVCPIVYNALEEFKHLTGFHPVKHGH
jgi:uncharacterized protein